jgi:hypothetical protein
MVAFLMCMNLRAVVLLDNLAWAAVQFVLPDRHVVAAREDESGRGRLVQKEAIDRIVADPDRL